MIGYRMVFDIENLKLGWSNSSCKYTVILFGLIMENSISLF